MANISKHSAGAVGNLFEHYARKNDNTKAENGLKKNKFIDTERTKLNYNLAPKRDESQLEYLQKRVGEVHHQKRKDLNVLCTWCVTQPKDFEGSTENFMRETYNFLSKKYGEKNVVSAWVHMDETTPHLHFAFVPVVFDEKKNREKISAKELITRKELQKFHGELQNYLETALDCPVNIQNEATRNGNKTVDELKRETAFEEKLQEIKDEANKAYDDANKAFEMRTEYEERARSAKAELDEIEKKLASLPGKQEINDLEKIARVMGSNELPKPKKKLGGKWVIEFDSEEEAKKIQNAFSWASKLQGTFLGAMKRAREMVAEATERAKSIVQEAKKEANSLKEQVAMVQLKEVQRDFPELFEDDVYQGKDYNKRKSLDFTKDHDFSR